MNRILAISGSLRSQASSTATLKAMIEISPDNIEISIYEGIGNLPHFNPDIDLDEALAPVLDWRNHLQDADSIIFCTPEYAHGVPGVLKNALDWIVSSSEFMHKPTAVISVSPSSSGGDKANAALVQTLRVMMADIVEEAILCIPAVSNKFDAQSQLIDPTTSAALHSVIQALALSITAT